MSNSIDNVRCMQELEGLPRGARVGLYTFNSLGESYSEIVVDRVGESYEFLAPNNNDKIVAMDGAFVREDNIHFTKDGKIVIEEGNYVRVRYGSDSPVYEEKRGLWEMSLPEERVSEPEPREETGSLEEAVAAQRKDYLEQKYKEGH